MSGPTVVVDWAPEGWTHIGGPGMHLLIGLHEEDEQTLHASDAADGGDLDDVLEVLTAGGMRRAKHFVGVHTGDTTRIVAFGPVAAVVTLADGSEHDVRAASARVWADLDLTDAPERIVLRVLDESEREQPAPPQTLTSAGPVAAASPAAPAATRPAAASPAAPAQEAPASAGSDEDETAGESGPTAASSAPAPAPADERDGRDAAPGPDAAPPAAVPTFGAPAAAAEPGRTTSSWGRSWARRDEPEAPTTVDSVTGGAPQAAPPTSPAPQTAASGSPVAQQVSSPAEAPVPDGESGSLGAEADSLPAIPALRSWASAHPPAPVRGQGVHAVDDAAPTTPAVASPATPEPAAPSADPVGAQPSSAPAAAAAAAPPAPGPTFEVPVSTPPTVREEPGPPVAPAGPVAADLPAADAGRDFESTWASRPEAPEEPKPAAANATPAPTAPALATEPDASGEDDPAPAAPSYDYLFGHTTAVDEHRRVLAELTKVDQGDEHHDDHHDQHHDENDGGTGTPGPAAAAAPVADASPAPVTNPVPEAPAAPAQPVAGTSGGLISAVPWATSSPAPAAAPTSSEAPVDTPTFSGRHTPPPAPSLLPPVHTPPPGVRAPQATPLISTGPPPASPAPAPAPEAPTATGPAPAP
uniref:hypothetical protein n=1 Tax=Intrasporangium flavum TaxID=1428657 RepID=UPI001A96B178